MRNDLVGLLTIVRKETLRILRIWTQTLLPPVINIVLYLLIFGSFIGSRVGSIGQDSYINFIVPGLILMAVIANSYGNVSSSFFSAKFQKNLEEILVSPVPDSFIVLGYSFGGIVRGLLVTACLVGVVLVAPGLDLKIQHPFLALIVLLLTASFFSFGGLLNALLARKFDDVSFIPTFILTPLTYLGGVFYPLSGLPEFWAKLSLANPVFHMVSALRYAFLGSADLPLSYALIFLVAGNIALFLACLFYIKRGQGIRN